MDEVGIRVVVTVVMFVFSIMIRVWLLILVFQEVESTFDIALPRGACLCCHCLQSTIALWYLW